MKALVESGLVKSTSLEPTPYTEEEIEKYFGLAIVSPVGTHLSLFYILCALN